MDNDFWLKYSKYIAIKFVVYMRTNELTQQDIADKLDCSRQYVSKLLSGKLNLSLESIGKIEKAPDIQILTFSF